MRKYLLSLLTSPLLILFAMTLSACSGGKSPVEPMIKDSNAPALPDSSVNPLENRDVIAVYDAIIDPDAGTFTITPGVRDAAFHFPLTQLYPNVLKITGYGWTPNFWANIKLKHPFPGSGIDAFDPRVIAILPANSGVSFNYPIFNCVGNNKVLLEPDGYTKLFDNLGGSIPGNTNPFKAYFKDQPNRVWSSTGVTEETQRWNMNLSGFGGPLQYKLVVDVSTNYPNPPQLVVDNAPEPVQIKPFIERDLTTYGGDSPIEVTLLDWQEPSDIKCKIESPDLFAGVIQLFYSGPGPNPNEYIFSGTILNSLLAPEGNYSVLIASWDVPTDIHTFCEATAIVSDSTSGNGNLIWAKRAGGTSGDYGYAITTLSDNSTVVTGYISGSATFGPGEINQTVLTSATGEMDIFIAQYNANGTLAWAKRAGGKNSDSSRGITTLSDNSTVVTGYFSNSATFGPGEPNQTILTATGFYDIFIARYNSDGTLSWAKRAGGSSFLDQDSGCGITTLSDNSTVVTGMFSGSTTFGPGEPNQTVLTTAGSWNIFIARYNPDGTLSWAKRAGGESGGGYGLGITTLSDNSTVVTGGFSGSAIFGESEPNQIILTSAGWDIFIAQYNPDGTLAWAKRAGGSDYDDGSGITTLSDNSTVVTGGYHDSATFGPSEPNETILTGGDCEIFIARYNPNGTLAWAKRAGGSVYPEDNGNGITTLSDNSTVVTGMFWGSATFGPDEPNQTVLTSAGYYDIFIARYNPNGTLAWAKRAGGAEAELEGGDMGQCITTLSDNSTVVAGKFWGSSTFGPGEPNQTVLTSAGYDDIFVARFKP